MKKRKIGVRLFTFDNHPPQHLWNNYQIWVGGLVTGRGLYVTKPQSEEEDDMMRMSLHDVYGYKDKEVEAIMNFINDKL